MFIDRISKEYGQIQWPSARESINHQYHANNEIRHSKCFDHRLGYDFIPLSGRLCRINFIRKLIPKQKNPQNPVNPVQKTKTKIESIFIKSHLRKANDYASCKEKSGG